jgi:carbon monoxide dehydrogenase subunit G
MDLKHEFTVPATVEETWEAFNDIASVGECFPGAQVTEVDGDTFKGTVKVKLGPIALVYTGVGTFVEKDESARTMKIEAKGKDKRGNGTAGADVLARMTDVGGATRVEVITDLAITGKPAQFGRGVIQDVSDKLLGQFTACLAEKVGAAEAPAAEEPPAPDVAEARMHNMRSVPADAPPPVQEVPPRRDYDADNALDLGATVLPVLLKAYGKQAAAGLGVVLLVVWVVRALRRR